MTDTLNGSGAVASNGTGISRRDFKDTFITPASSEFYLRQTHLSSGINSVKDHSTNGMIPVQDSNCAKFNVLGPHYNPFVYKCEVNRTIDKVTNVIFTIFVLPIRVIIICHLLVLAWIFATIGLWGLTITDIGTKPLDAWRRTIRRLTALTLRVMFIVASFHNVKIIGKRATRQQAPILAMAPHSTFFDSLVPVWLDPLSVLAKGETATIPFFGKFINFTQPLYVWREDSDSRQSTVKGIIDRANAKEDFPQVIIFPEGTCTNRTCLITFKNGAFYPGVPIQPVCIRYPNKLDTVTWTWEGPGVLKLLWLTFCRIHSRIEIEFLPVYIPNEEERADPVLFATNVRYVMARALNVPTSDYTYNDCKLMAKARQMNIPHVTEIVEIYKLRERIGLSKTNIEEQVVTSYLVHDANCMVSLTEFALRLQISVEDPATIKLFDIFNVKSSNTIDFRRYLHSALFLIKSDLPAIELIQLISKMYDDCGKGPGRLTRNALHNILGSTLAITFENSLDIFAKIDAKRRGFVATEELIEYLHTKPEYEYVFKTSSDAKKSTKNTKQKAL